MFLKDQRSVASCLHKRHNDSILPHSGSGVSCKYYSWKVLQRAAPLREDFGNMMYVHVLCTLYFNDVHNIVVFMQAQSYASLACSFHKQICPQVRLEQSAAPACRLSLVDSAMFSSSSFSFSFFFISTWALLRVSAVAILTFTSFPRGCHSTRLRNGRSRRQRPYDRIACGWNR